MNLLFILIVLGKSFFHNSKSMTTGKKAESLGLRMIINLTERSLHGKVNINKNNGTDDWLEALNHAVNNQFPNGILSKNKYLFLISDNGYQPTSQKFMKECSALEIKQIFTCFTITLKAMPTLNELYVL